MRLSRSPLKHNLVVSTEEIVVGDNRGSVYYYVVEWPDTWEIARDMWPGTVYLIGKMCLHNQQICGFAWSGDGKLLASGSDDNFCCTVDVDKFLADIKRHNKVGDLADDEQDHDAERSSQFRAHKSPNVSMRRHRPVNAQRRSFEGIFTRLPGTEQHRWLHEAAVKAIAFCPWRKDLVATGGGTHDHCIHFYRTSSGAALASISVSAQVTSLIWSTTRREIAVTFGYAEPEHPIRIAIFTWPGCHQVAAIPWERGFRALHAVSCPSPIEIAPSFAAQRQSRDNGCIVVACSDRTLKFYELWPTGPRIAAGRTGPRHIREISEGIQGGGEVIR